MRCFLANSGAIGGGNPFTFLRLSFSVCVYKKNDGSKRMKESNCVEKTNISD